MTSSMISFPASTNSFSFAFIFTILQSNSAFITNYIFIASIAKIESPFFI